MNPRVSGGERKQEDIKIKIRERRNEEKWGCPLVIGFRVQKVKEGIFYNQIFIWIYYKSKRNMYKVYEILKEVKTK